MKQLATEGHNVTGVAASQGRAEAMRKGMDRFPPTSKGTDQGPGMVRIGYSRQGEPVGSVPPSKAAKKNIANGEAAVQLLDKLGERLAFERTGSRLYEALISKHEAFGGFAGGPSREDLLELHDQELNHFTMLEQAIEKLGGDPTAMTPSADLAGTAGEGVLKVVTDPRTTLLQSLEAILVAELTDNDGWEMLGALSKRTQNGELTRMCQEAQRVEEQHLEKVRTWLRAGHNGATRAAKSKG